MFPNSYAVNKILRSQRLLKKNNTAGHLSQIIIKPDSTTLQRVLRKKMIEEMEKRKKERRRKSHNTRLEDNSIFSKEKVKLTSSKHNSAHAQTYVSCFYTNAQSLINKMQ